MMVSFIMIYKKAKIEISQVHEIFVLITYWQLPPLIAHADAVELAGLSIHLNPCFPLKLYADTAGCRSLNFLHHCLAPGSI